jgi:methylthioribulose-1-phosphate dehydratase
MAREQFAEIRSQLAGIGRRFYTRGWALGTSGNFSAVVSRQPLQLAITASSVPKGRLSPADILTCGEDGAVLAPGSKRSSKGRSRSAVRRPSDPRRPSAETLLHLEIARRRDAGAILHTHSVWTTILSDIHAADGGFDIAGFEMLKGLNGVRSHEHREWIPIIENDQDMPRLARRVGATLDECRNAHAFLLSRHGLYTWGETLDEAERHVEILEFLFEALGWMIAIKQVQGSGFNVQGSVQGSGFSVQASPPLHHEP